MDQGIIVHGCSYADGMRGGHVGGLCKGVLLRYVANSLRRLRLSLLETAYLVAVPKPPILKVSQIIIELDRLDPSVLSPSQLFPFGQRGPITRLIA